MKSRTVFKHFRVDKETGELKPWFKTFKQSDGSILRPDFTPMEKGGLTVCFLMQDGEPVSYGVSECSQKDSFCYAIGRKISFGRAVAKLDGKKIKHHSPRKSPAREFFGAMQNAIESIEDITTYIFTV